MSCCLVGSRMAESERLSVHGISLQRHSSEVFGNTRRCPEGCCCCVVLYRHSKLLGCYWSPVLGLNTTISSNMCLYSIMQSFMKNIYVGEYK